MAQKRTGHVSYDGRSGRQGRGTDGHADRYSICSFVTIDIAFRGKAPVKAEASLHRGSRAPVRPALRARGAPRGTLENRVGGARGSLEPLSWPSLAPTMRLSLPRYLKRNGVHQWREGGMRGTRPGLAGIAGILAVPRAPRPDVRFAISHPRARSPTTVSFGELYSVVRRIYERTPGNERPFSLLSLSLSLSLS